MSAPVDPPHGEEPNDTEIEILKRNKDMMTWDTLIQLLGWAVPGGLGASVTWLLSRRQRRTRDAKLEHDTYRKMYEDVSVTLSSIQMRNNELNETLDQIRLENSRLKRAVVALRKAMEAISSCRHYDDCPVRRELPFVSDGLEGVGVGGDLDCDGRHDSEKVGSKSVGSRDTVTRRNRHGGSSAERRHGGLASGRRVVGGAKQRHDACGDEDPPRPCGDGDPPPSS